MINTNKNKEVITIREILLRKEQLGRAQGGPQLPVDNGFFFFLNLNGCYMDNHIVIFTDLYIHVLCTFLLVYYISPFKKIVIFPGMTKN